jgi:peptidyl-prolyl cis-trans isomerase SurA
MLTDMKKIVLIFFLFISTKTTFSQILVRYGNQIITKEEFLKAFRKNNTKVRPTEKTYRDYLDLYIRYRLKVQAAYDMRLDTLPGQLTELQNFKSQIVDQYLNDETSLNQMAREAWLRSQRDLRISFIFVSSPRNAPPNDTAKAWTKIQGAYQALKSNKDFGETAIQFSEDPFVKNNRGDIGFITVFDLPYVMETMAYGTPLGKYSPVFRTNGGYLIVKKTAERKAEGRIRVAQILMAFPYQATEQIKMQTRQRADSIYRVILNGADFGELARKFSGDNLSYQLGGVLPEFGIGKYEYGFEAAAYSLKKDGDVCAPYESEFGLHIIKRIKRIPAPTVADQKTLNALKEKIKSDPRVAVSRRSMMEKVFKQTNFKQIIPADKNFWNYTDSLMQNKKPALNSGIDDQSVLFQFPDKKILISDWIVYRKSLKSSPNLISGKTNSDILDAYRQQLAFEYYKANLERYNAVYAEQVAEFRDGNLLFEIMQRQVWNRAGTDSAGLKKYFEHHKEQYIWKPGAEAIIFTSPNMQTAQKLRLDIENDKNGWRKISDGQNGPVQADSGRFEQKQLPASASAIKAGMLTPVRMISDKSAQFAYIIKLYSGSTPRTFEDARGLVINDYQTELENQWIAELKKKYPVSINESIFRTLPVKPKS